MGRGAPGRRFWVGRSLLGVGTLRLETMIAAAPAACFDLSLSVDAHTSSMSASSEQAVAGVTSGVMALGDAVTWRARHFGLRFQMTSRISAYERPRRFVDEQVRGPFATWWHEHTFAAVDSGGTLMVDVVRFMLPFGPLGTVAERLVVGSYLTDLLQQRNAWLKNELEVAAVAEVQSLDAGAGEERAWWSGDRTTSGRRRRGLFEDGHRVGPGLQPGQ